MLLRIRDDGSAFPGMLSIQRAGSAGADAAGGSRYDPARPLEHPHLDIVKIPTSTTTSPGMPLPGERRCLLPPQCSPRRFQFDCMSSPMRRMPTNKSQAMCSPILAREEGQIAWATMVGAADPAVFISAVEQAELHPLESKAFQAIR